MLSKSPEFLESAKKLKGMSDKDFVSLVSTYSNQPAQLKTFTRARCYYDLKAFATTFFTDIDKDGNVSGHAKDPFNKMHKKFFKNFDPEAQNLRKCILASRGSAKTTLFCLIYVLHKICYGNDRFIMMLSSTQPLARTKSKAIHSEVLNNEKLKWAFDLNFASKRKASSDAFTLKSCYGECHVQSHGFYSEIRGIKFEESRPTLLLLDDVVPGEEVFSEEQRIKMDRHFNTDIIQTIQPGTNIIFIGTRLHDEDLGSLLSRKPLWDTEIYPAFEQWPERIDLWDEWKEILKDPTVPQNQKLKKADAFYKKNKTKMNKGAKVLWPERENVLELMKQRFDVGTKEFDAEKQMIAFLTGDVLFEDVTYFYPTEQDGHEGFFLVKENRFIPYDESRFVKYYALDPATGERKKTTKTKPLSNSARIIAAKDTHTGNIYLIDCYIGRPSPTKLMEEMCDLHTHHDFHKMFLEENLFRDAFRDSIPMAIEKWNDKHKTNITLPIVSIYNDIDKDQRIYALEPHFAQAKIIVNKHINPQYLAELQSYPNSDKNDALDATEILWQGVHQKGFRFVNLD